MSAASGQSGEHQQSERARLHRSQLRAHNMALQAAAAAPEGDGAGAIDALHAWRIAELLHHLFEIMYVASQRTALVAPLLLDWLHRHFTSRFSVELFPAPDAQARPDYWPAVRHFVLQAHFTAAHTLLAAHARHQQADVTFRQLAQLVRTRPLLRGVSTVSEFLPKWRVWRADVQTFAGQLRAADPDHAELSVVAALLLGEERAVTSEAGMWVEALVALVYSAHVEATAAQLPSIARAVLASTKALSNERLDSVLRAVFRGDPDAALLHLYDWRLGESLWLPAHLSLFLDASRRDPHLLSPLARDNRLTLADMLLLEYADELRRQPGLAPLALVYAAAVSAPKELLPRAFLAATLERQEPRSEADAHRLLEHCRRLDLPQVARTVQTVTGLRRLRQAGPAAALHWLLLARDERRVAAVAGLWLREVQRTGDVATLSAAMEALGEPVLYSPPLAFVGQWAALLRLLHAKQLRPAAERLVDMFANKVAPRRLWLPLLVATLPQLVAAPTSPVTLPQVHLLMQCAEDALLSHRSAQLLRELGPQHELAVAQLRLHLSQLRTAALRQQAA